MSTWPGGFYGRWAKPQYIALLEAVGSWKIARQKKDIIVWRDDKAPPDDILRSWEVEWQDGKVAVDENDVRRMRQRLRAQQEWGAWQSQEAAVAASIALSRKAEDGTLSKEKQVQMQYAGMNVAYQTKEIAAAFGTPKPTQTAFQQIVINAGENPHKRPKQLKTPSRKKLIEAAQESVIDAEFRQVEIGSTDSADV